MVDLFCDRYAIALNAGMAELVKGGIIGTILEMLLLLPGLAMVAGGLKYPQQRYLEQVLQASVEIWAL